MILFEELNSDFGKFKIELQKDRTLVNELVKNLTWDLSDDQKQKDYLMYIDNITVTLSDEKRKEINNQVMINVIEYHGGLDHIVDLLESHIKDELTRSLGLNEFIVSADVLEEGFIIPLIIGTDKINQPYHSIGSELLQASDKVITNIRDYSNVMNAIKHRFNYTASQIQYGIFYKKPIGPHQRYMVDRLKNYEGITEFKNYNPSQIPLSGPTGNLFYELVRECHRILYRWYNDGDTGMYIAEDSFIDNCNLYDALHHELNVSEKRRLIRMIIDIRRKLSQCTSDHYTLMNLDDTEDWVLNDYLIPDGITEPDDIVTSTLILGEALRKIKETDEAFLDRSFDKDLRSKLHYLELWS